MTSALKQYPQLKQLYEKHGELGEGSFGKVYLAQRLSSQTEGSTNQNSNSSNKAKQQPTEEGNKVGKQEEWMAIKKLKPYNRKQSSSHSIVHIEQYPQVTVMQNLCHPNLMSIRNILQQSKGFEVNHYLVLDLGVGLMEVTRHKELSLSFEQIRWVVFQLVQALDHMHNQGYMHRDLKPSNVYLMPNGTLKLGDFSISRPLKNIEEHSAPSSQQQDNKTGNVTTRLYRAPQIIYGSKHYDQSIDIWSLGCTLAQLVLHQPIFPGTTDIHQLELIFSLLGCPQDHWPSAQELPYYIEFENNKPPKGLKNLIPNMPMVFMDFLERCLTMDPAKRPTTQQLLKHQLLEGIDANAKVEFGKVCSYLHEKTLKNMFVKHK